MGIKNTTTSVAQIWGSTQGKLVRVEVLVLCSALLCVLVDMFGSRRRNHSHGFFRFFVWVLYTLFPVLGPFTIGLMQDVRFRDQTFVLWGAILLFIQVSAVYKVHDIERRKKVLVQHVLQIILVLWLILNCKGRNRSYTATIWIFWIQSIIQAYRNVGTLSNASKKGLLKKSKVVADYMMIEHEQIAQDHVTPPDPKTMQGYRYIFHGEEEVASLLPTELKYGVVLGAVNIPTTPEDRDIFGVLNIKFTTIDEVWQWIESKSLEGKDTMKEVALSFTLFKLLKRRLCHYQIGEAGKPKTLDFVLGGLLSEESKYVRSFRVVETELAFLYDFLYTRFDMKMNRMSKSLLFLSINVIVWSCISGAFSRHYHRSNLEQRIHKIDVTHWVTIVLLTIVLPLNFLTTSFHSRWLLLYWLQVKETRFLSRTSNIVKHEEKKTWQRALGQYSLLLKFDYHPWNLLPRLSLGLVEATREGQKAEKKIELTDEVIMRVLSGFKNNNGQLQDGHSALARNRLGIQFSWACTLPTHIHKILVWHIGTTIAMDSHQDPLTGSDYDVAKTLSNYCAYLVAFVPDMLPGLGSDNQCIFDAVIMEARGNLSGSDTMSRKCQKLQRIQPINSSGNILKLGGRLGSELRRVVPEEASRWKVLADFWAEFILFLAPSSNYDIHTEKLAAGGEFMTHLWALLTHAGILERPSSADGVGGNNHGTLAHDSPA